MNLFKGLSDKFVKKKPEEVESEAGFRMLKLFPGDSALILRSNGKSLLVESDRPGENGEIPENEKLLLMTSLYLGNRDFVNVLYQMFEEAVDAANAKRVTKSDDLNDQA